MRAAQKIKKRIRNLYRSVTLHGIYPFCYKKGTARPVDPKKIVFLEVRGIPGLTAACVHHPDRSLVSDNFRLLYEKLEQTGDYDLWMMSIGEGMASHLQEIRNSIAIAGALADAACIYVSDSSYLLSALPIRAETKVIQTWHACGAFKRFGYSIADRKFGADRRDLERFPVHKNFDCVTVSSPQVAWAYAEAFHMEEQPERIQPLGVSRTDCFYQPDRLEAARKKLQQVLEGYGADCAEKQIVLYAPTFRGQAGSAFSPDVLDFEKLQSQLGDSCLFLCKHHPFVKHPAKIPDSCRAFAFDVTKQMEIEELLMVSDVCISDYSSLIFEYSLFERPMLFLAYDLEEYFDWRGFYYPYEEMAPGPILRTTEEVIACLKALSEHFDREQVIQFKEKFMSSCDGHATDRIIAWMEEKGSKKHE